MATPLKIGLIGGSGLGEALTGGAAGTSHHPDTPFGAPSGPIVEAEIEGVPALLLARHGEGHALNPSAVPYRANLFALKMLGCTHVLAGGAVGSLRDEFRPRDLVVPDQIIDKTRRRPGTFYESAAVHVEFAEPFCPALRRLLNDAGADLKSEMSDSKSEMSDSKSEIPRPAVHDGGCYVCMEGPAFGTRAESLMHRLWGGDLIGMTLMPEAKLAREAELPYAAVCLVTDYDSWKRPGPPTATNPAAPPFPGADPAKSRPPEPQALLDEIVGNLQAATDAAVALLRRAVRLAGDRADALADCPATGALDRAIWTDRKAIDAAEVERLAPLWGRHFGG